MHNLIVLGCGRSGTSMVAGTLSTAGYWTDDSWDSDKYNPKGYFESLAIHRINEEILSPVINSPFESLPATTGTIEKNAPDEQSWLGILEPKKQLSLNETLVSRMRDSLTKTPFCLKDVRFSYTLDLWKPYFQNTKFICVFRHPASTINSIVQYASQRSYLSFLGLDKCYAQRLWQCIYLHILEKQCLTGDWLFVHYDQLFSPTHLQRLETFSQAKLDASFPEQQLKKPVPPLKLDKQTLDIYKVLCRRAGYGC